MIISSQPQPPPPSKKTVRKTQNGEILSEMFPKYQVESR